MYTLPPNPIETEDRTTQADKRDDQMVFVTTQLAQAYNDSANALSSAIDALDALKDDPESLAAILKRNSDFIEMMRNLANATKNGKFKGKLAPGYYSDGDVVLYKGFYMFKIGDGSWSEQDPWLDAVKQWEPVTGSKVGDYAIFPDTVTFRPKLDFFGFTEAPINADVAVDTQYADLAGVMHMYKTGNQLTTPEHPVLSGMFVALKYKGF